MSDTAATLHSASSGEDAGEIKTPEVRVCEAFSSSAGNVIFKSSDNVIFRVEDYYLKANSLDNPLPLDEDSVDLEIMLSIITGRAREVLDRATTWKQAERLYKLVDKYQIDGHRPWFSQICCAHAAKEPWEALFLSCNQSPVETSIIKTAVSDGFPLIGRNNICTDRYFKVMQVTTTNARCWSTIRTSNITTSFGLKLGLRGLLAYNLTFGTIISSSNGAATWSSYGDDFVRNALAVERAKETG